MLLLPRGRLGCEVLQPTVVGTANKLQSAQQHRISPQLHSTALLQQHSSCGVLLKPQLLHWCAEEAHRPSANTVPHGRTGDCRRQVAAPVCIAAHKLLC